jgi:hypothetical protein
LSELDLSDSTTSAKPAVLMISLEKRSFFDEMYSVVMTRLRSVATVVEVTNIVTTVPHISKAQEDYTVIIVTDPKTMEKEFRVAQIKLVEYAKGGGTVIFGFLVGNFGRFDHLDKFFKNRWNISWNTGCYRGGENTLNPRINSDFAVRRRPNLNRKYSLKALSLSNADYSDRVYSVKNLERLALPCFQSTALDI